MHKRLFLHFGVASLGSLSGCLATAPSSGKNGAGPAAEPSGAPQGPDWEALRTPASGIPSSLAQQSARQAFERASVATAAGPAVFSAQALEPIEAARAAMDKSFAAFERQWPSIDPKRRQAAMARLVTPSIAQNARQMVFLADRQIRPSAPSSPAVRTASAASAASASSRGAPAAGSTTATEVVVQPGRRVRFNIKGYCLDAGLPAPVQGDLSYLAPVSARVIAAELAPLYEGAAAWAARSSNNDGLYPPAQQLYWALAHAGTDNHWARNPGPDVRRAMDEITPGGYKIFDNYNKTELAKREVLKAVLKQSGLDRKIGSAGVEQIARGDYAGAATRALEQQIAAGSRMPSQKGQGYSWLAPGVAARTTGSGPLAVDVEIINTGEQPYRFVPANFIAQPVDRKQPVALPARLTAVADTALNPDSVITAISQMFSALEDRVRGFFTQSMFAGAFDWMRLPSPLITADRSRARDWLVDLDSRYPLKTALGVTPFVGNALALYEAFSGTDWLYGNDLAVQDRALALGASIPAQSAALRGLEYLERKGFFTALGKITNRDEFVQKVFVDLYNAVEGPVYSTIVMPARGAFRSHWGENNTGASAAYGSSERAALAANPSLALVDEKFNALKILADAQLNLPAPAAKMLREQSANWPAIIGLR